MSPKYIIAFHNVASEVQKRLYRYETQGELRCGGLTAALTPRMSVITEVYHTQTEAANVTVLRKGT